ncbi:MAG: biotin/lipoyl-binding protein, partial [Flavobacterium sp.]
MYIHKIKNIALISMISITLLSACSGDIKKDEPAETVKQENKEEEVGLLELTPAQMKTVGIEVGYMENRNLASVVKANGQLEVPPQNKADVSILSGGIILRINVLEGQQVKKGQVLAVINNQDLIKIQQDYL